MFVRIWQNLTRKRVQNPGKKRVQDIKRTETPRTTNLHSSTLLIPVTVLGCFNRVALALLRKSCRNTVESRSPPATTFSDSHSTLVTSTCEDSDRDCMSMSRLNRSAYGVVYPISVQCASWACTTCRPREVPSAKMGIVEDLDGAAAVHQRVCSGMCMCGEWITVVVNLRFMYGTGLDWDGHTSRWPAVIAFFVWTRERAKCQECVALGSAVHCCAGLVRLSIRAWDWDVQETSGVA